MVIRRERLVRVRSVWFGRSNASVSGMQPLLNNTSEGDNLDKMSDGRSFPEPHELTILIPSISIFSTHLKKEEVSLAAVAPSIEARPMHGRCHEWR